MLKFLMFYNVINLENNGLVFVSTKTFLKTTSQHNTILHKRLCFAQYVSVEAKQFSTSAKYFAQSKMSYGATVGASAANSN